MRGFSVTESLLSVQINQEARQAVVRKIKDLDGVGVGRGEFHGLGEALRSDHCFYFEPRSTMQGDQKGKKKS